jgi:putative transposase
LQLTHFHANPKTLTPNTKIIPEHAWFDDNDRKEYKKFLKKQDPVTEEKIRRAISTSRPLGSERFIKKLERMLSRRMLPSKAARPKKTKMK